MSTSATHTVKKLQSQYRMLRIGEVTLWTFAATFLVYGILMVVPVSAALHITLALAAGMLTAAIRYRVLRLHKLGTAQIVAYINHQYPQLEESTDLLLQNEATLTILERIQQQRTLERFNAVYPAIKLPNKIGQAVVVFVSCLAVAVLFSAFNIHLGSAAPHQRSDGNTVSENTPPLPAEIDAINLTITAPAYTGLGVQKTDNPQISMPEGSTLHWEVIFSESVQRAQLIFSAGDTLALTAQGKAYTAHRTFTKSNFYQVRWKNADGGMKTSDYYKIEIIADAPPDVNFTNLQQFTEFKITDKLSFTVQATIKDDYGLRDAFIIATVSKGSGESVKFREEKLTFTQPGHIQGKTVQASRTIDLVKLGLEPGDELYFYAEAHDGKTPIANRARTETFFVSLRDTTSEEIAVDPGLGVDLMPEYFRSQRQIIIDSEKLLKDRKEKKISKQEFNSKSNELGYDQKILRLKYGEFLGEEFESGIGIGQGAPTGDDDHDHDEKEDVTKKYGHAHDTENEHNLVAEKKSEPEHHHHESADPDKKDNPMAEFMHQHDNEEEATFFTQSIRSKLKAALTVMWDAELHLRMYDPEKSLPYQYKALKLLKEISNDSRIYVHKTGFDPPPIKEDKRLSGDLTEIKSSRHSSNLKQEASYPALRQALEITEALLQQPSPVLTSRAKAALLKGGQALSALALERPGQFLKSLSLIKTLNEENLNGASLTSALTEIRRALWIALPQESTSPGAQPQTTHALNKTFLQNLEKLNDRN